MFSYGGFLWRSFLFNGIDIKDSVSLSTEEFAKVFGNEAHRPGKTGFFDILSFMAGAAKRNLVDLVSMHLDDGLVALGKMSTKDSIFTSKETFIIPQKESLLFSITPGETRCS